MDGLGWSRDQHPDRPATRRRRDLRRVVRRPGRPDPRAGPAPGRLQRVRRGARGRPRDRARHQPGHLLPPRAQARRRGLRPHRQGGHQQPGLGQRRLLHRAPARRRRRHGHPDDPTVLPRGRAGRRDDPGHDRRRPAPGARDLRRGDRDPAGDLRDRGPRHRGAAREVAARPALGRRARRDPRRGRRVDRREPRLDPRVLRRRRRDLRVRRRAGPWSRGRPCAAPAPGDRGRRRWAVDPADLDLPGEPRQPRAAPQRRLRHAGRALAHRPARRRVARHGADGASPHR